MLSSYRCDVSHLRIRLRESQKQSNGLREFADGTKQVVGSDKLATMEVSPGLAVQIMDALGIENTAGLG
jgi:hypothetical protein